MHLVHYYGVLAPNAKLRSKYLAHGDLWDHLYLQARRGDREFKSLKRPGASAASGKFRQ